MCKAFLRKDSPRRGGKLHGRHQTGSCGPRDKNPFIQMCLLIKIFVFTAADHIRTAVRMSRQALDQHIGNERCKQSSKVHTFSPANAHFFSASFLAGNGLVVS